MRCFFWCQLWFLIFILFGKQRVFVPLQVGRRTSSRSTSKEAFSCFWWLQKPGHREQPPWLRGAVNSGWVMQGIPAACASPPGEGAAFGHHGHSAVIPSPPFIHHTPGKRRLQIQEVLASSLYQAVGSPAQSLSPYPF